MSVAWSWTPSRILCKRYAESAWQRSITQNTRWCLVLLEADESWEGAGPYEDLPVGYYLVPLHDDDSPITTCPLCHRPLRLAPGGLPPVVDPDTPEAELVYQDEFDDDYLPRDAEYVAGEMALEEGRFQEAEQHFRTALDLDDRYQTEAGLYLGLSLLWQKRVSEAAECFDADLEDRGVRLSGFFSLWCAISAYESPLTFLAVNERYYAELGWLTPDNESEDDEGNEEQEKHSASTQPRDPLRVLQDLLSGDTIEDPETPGDRLLSGLISYLRKDYHRVLALLYTSTNERFGWASAFWMAMACIELRRYEEARQLLSNALSEDAKATPLCRVPPVLRQPLRWCRAGHAAFFGEVVQPLLTPT
jgi:tetratricopeptide (TPR) repeat protein